jgi:uncharacterized protein (TIGR03435 family)
MKKWLLCLVALLSLSSSALHAQDVTGSWQGTLPAGKGLRIVVKFSRDDGKLKALLYSIDQASQPIPASSVELEGTTLRMAIVPLGATYEGKLGADGKSITGTFTQGGQPLPLIFSRATPETVWAIPEPPAKLPPMAASADPSFEVATIKPSKPGAQGKGIRVQGRHFFTINTTMNDLVQFAYGIQVKQIVNAPAWFETDKFDLDGNPDVEGVPNDKQLKGMLKKLFAERFKLTFHNEKKELSVFALTVAKTGSKLKQSDADAGGLPGLFFRPGATGSLVLAVQNATMADFTNLLQSTVFDRPVADQTGLVGRFNFTLTFTPDDTQMGGMGIKLPPPSDTAEAPPSIFKAIQDQDGLKLEPAKAPVDVLVIDHVEKPSDN